MPRFIASNAEEFKGLEEAYNMLPGDLKKNTTEVFADLVMGRVNFKVAPINIEYRDRICIPRPNSMYTGELSISFQYENCTVILECSGHNKTFEFNNPDVLNSIKRIK